MAVSTHADPRRVRLGSLAILAMLLAYLAPAAPTAQSISPNIVISQVYGGGGNTGAPYTHDFVELFNRGTTTVSLAGWSLQYASATGTGNFGATATQISELSGTLAPGHYLLVQGSGSTIGSPLPPPDVVDSTPLTMSATGGKVALVNNSALLGCNGGSTPCSAAALASIIDLVGYGSANFFEGGGPAPSPSNTTAVVRLTGGCTETDSNAADFHVAAPEPRNTASPLALCSTGDTTPMVSSTTPAAGSPNTATATNITIRFSEPVVVTGSWFDINCTSSGAHTAGVSGGPTEFTLNPDSDFASGESCTVTVAAAQVTDQDSLDPPDGMAADYHWSFTIATITRIRDIQGMAHISPRAGQSLTTSGIVTALTSNGFYLQDPAPDSDDASSEGIFVFTSTPPAVTAGDAVQVSGRVTEFRAGGSSSTNLTITELTNSVVSIVSSGNPLPAPTIIGAGGRVPPGATIDDDAAGSVETSGTFDAASDGIDFYESLEGMRVQVNNAVAVGPTNNFGEIPVLAENGAAAAVRTNRGGIVIRPGDFNPERIIIDNVIAPTPLVNVGDHFAEPLTGVMDYSFGNFKLLLTSTATVLPSGLSRERAAPAAANELAIATLNVENLDPNDSDEKFRGLAELVVTNLGSPDIISLEEIQDNTGPVNDGTVDASMTYSKLSTAIIAAGGPAYDFRQINPLNNADGGEPGGNIRVGFLFRTDRGLSFVDRPGGDATTPTTATPGPHLSFSPGRIEPSNTAWNSSRKPLAGEFRYRGETLFVIANHFNSKGGDQPLFGRFQPPARSSEVQRQQQAQLVHNFVQAILSFNPRANVVVLGDLNDFEFSPALDILKGGILHDLVETLPQEERYSYVFDGNSQTLDHILVSDNLFNRPFTFDIVHVNAEFADQVSDHDPQVVRLRFNQPPSVSAGAGYIVSEGGATTLTAQATDPDGGPLNFVWDLDNDGSFETAGQSVTFSAAQLDGPSVAAVSVQVTDDAGLTDVAGTTVEVRNVAPQVAAVQLAPQPSALGSAVTASATFSDPALNDAPFTCTVDYGAGPQPGTVNGATCTGPAHTYTLVGSYAVVVAITDKDGGVGTGSTTQSVIYTFSGFFQPVDNLPTVNVVKAGSAVPLKFSLSGDQGLDIFDTGYPKSQIIECGAADLVDGIEETINAGTSSLSYDATTDQYVYVWKTDKHWAGTCRQLVLVLNDGSVHRANFKLTQ